MSELDPRLLSRIPHLEVTTFIRPPIEELLSEFAAVDDMFERYVFDDEEVSTPAGAIEPSITYQVIDVVGWPRSNRVRSLVPKTIAWIESICETSPKARFTSVAPGSDTSWHRHAQGSEPVFFLHVPLRTNAGVRFGVRNTLSDQNVFWQHYDVGEAWLFNSTHLHLVENRGVTNRYHLYAAIPVNDARFRALVQGAIVNYSGPLLQESETELT